MKIVIDTNILISGVFFGGFPRNILSAIVRGKLTACATSEIIEEYQEIVQEMIARKQGHIHLEILDPLIQAMEIIDPVSKITICRDPDDNKFIECAKDAQALYIVSGDKDLLVLEQYENIQIVTAKDFCMSYLA
jgi:putative PIN family toxin of toxin-antitoxin system